jgi:hypothetical protein
LCVYLPTVAVYGNSKNVALGKENYILTQNGQAIKTMRLDKLWKNATIKTDDVHFNKPLFIQHMSFNQP